MPVHCTELYSKGLTGIVFLFKMIINYDQKRNQTARKVRQMRNGNNIQKCGRDVALASGEIITLGNHLVKASKLKENKGQSQS